MASILKVDTIQDQSGNNIINENADTITIGASGDTITIPTGATMTVPNGGLSGQNYPAFRVTMGSDQNFSNNTNTKINFDTVDFDTDSAYDTTNKRFVCPSGKAGKYVFISGAGFFLDDTRRVTFRFKKNGSNITNSAVQVESSSASSLTLIRTVAIITLAATDYVEAFAEQENGDTKTMRSQDVDFQGFRIGA